MTDALAGLAGSGDDRHERRLRGRMGAALAEVNPALALQGRSTPSEPLEAALSGTSEPVCVVGDSMSDTTSRAESTKTCGDPIITPLPAGRGGSHDLDFGVGLVF